MIFTSGSLGNSLEILFKNASDSHRLSVDKIFRIEIIDAASGQNDVGARGQNFLDALFCDIGLTLTDSLK